MLASLSMTGRLLLVSWLSLFAVSGCTTHAPGALGVDTPLVPYVAPDVDELTAGDDFATEEEDVEQEAVPAEVPAVPQPTTKTPAAPATPSKPGK
jgi:hypothetical protein